MVKQSENSTIEDMMIKLIRLNRNRKKFIIIIIPFLFFVDFLRQNIKKQFVLFFDINIVIIGSFILYQGKFDRSY